MNVNNANNPVFPQHLRQRNVIDHDAAIAADNAPNEAQPIIHQGEGAHPAGPYVRNRMPAWLNQAVAGLRHGGAQLAGPAVNAASALAHNLRFHHDEIFISALVGGGVSAFTTGSLVLGALLWHTGLGFNASRENELNAAAAMNTILFRVQPTVGIAVFLYFATFNRCTQPHPRDEADREAIEEARRGEQLRDMNLAGRPLADVVRVVRGLRAGASSSTSMSFDWSQPGLFVDRNGMDRGAEVSHFFNRIQALALTDNNGRLSPSRVALFNGLLDKFENDSESRQGFANQVLQMNATCIDRASEGFNAMMRSLQAADSSQMGDEDFLLHTIRDAAFAEADKALVVAEGTSEINVHISLELHRQVVMRLREVIPGFPEEIETHRFQTTELSNRMAPLAEKIAEKFSNPQKIAQSLLASKQNALMEERLHKELHKISEGIDQELDRKCEEFTQLHGREPDLAQMGELALALKPDLENEKKDLYARVIADILKVPS